MSRTTLRQVYRYWIQEGKPSRQHIRPLLFWFLGDMNSVSPATSKSLSLQGWIGKGCNTSATRCFTPCIVFGHSSSPILCQPIIRRSILRCATSICSNSVFSDANTGPPNKMDGVTAAAKSRNRSPIGTWWLQIHCRYSRNLHHQMLVLFVS